MTKVSKWLENGRKEIGNDEWLVSVATEEAEGIGL